MHCRSGREFLKVKRRENCGIEEWNINKKRGEKRITEIFGFTFLLKIDQIVTVTVAVPSFISMELMLSLILTLS